MKEPHYTPALKYNFLTPFFDFLLKWTTREYTFKSGLIEQANVEDKQRILDVGCGTATLLIMLKNKNPGIEAVGIDGDSEILNIAEEKISKSSLNIALDQGMSFDLPYPDSSFDCVLSSLFFHHLTSANKERTLKEIYRVLKPGGELHIADWGKAQNILMRLAFFAIQILDGFSTTTDNVKGLLPEFIEEAGFTNIEEPTKYMTIYGSLSLYKATKSK